MEIMDWHTIRKGAVSEGTFGPTTIPIHCSNLYPGISLTGKQAIKKAAPRWGAAFWFPLQLSAGDQRLEKYAARFSISASLSGLAIGDIMGSVRVPSRKAFICFTR